MVRYEVIIINSSRSNNKIIQELISVSKRIGKKVKKEEKIALKILRCGKGRSKAHLLPPTRIPQRAMLSATAITVLFISSTKYY